MWRRWLWVVKARTGRRGCPSVDGSMPRRRERRVTNLSQLFMTSRVQERNWYVLKNVLQSSELKKIFQKTSTSTEFNDYPDSEGPPIPNDVLSKDHAALLSEFINKVYLRPQTISSLSERFAEESSIELYSFFLPAIASKLEKGLYEKDA
jgi:hypothetical protein